MYLFHVAVVICVFGVIQGYPNDHHQERSPNGDTGLCPPPVNVSCAGFWFFKHPRFCTTTHLNPCPLNEICCLSSSNSDEGCCVHEKNLIKVSEEYTERNGTNSGSDDEGNRNQVGESTELNEDRQKGVDIHGGEPVDEDGGVPEESDDTDGEGAPEEEEEDPKVTDDPNATNEETVTE